MTEGTAQAAKTPASVEAAPKKPKKTSRATDGGVDAFAREVARVSATQICEAAGFAFVQQSALESLSDIMVRYVSDIGKAAHYYAELAGRTQSNALDVILALEDLQSPNGFAGASDIPSAVRDIIRYASRADEVPFSRPVPPFPVAKETRAARPSFISTGEQAPRHVPGWLPAFPDEHTYKNTAMSVSDERNHDSGAEKFEQARQRRWAERSLVNLQQRLTASGTFSVFDSDKSSFSNPKTHVIPKLNSSDSQIHAPNAQANGHSSNGISAFFAPPLGPEDRPVSSVKIPDGLRVAKNMGEKFPSVVEAFGDVVEKVKNASDVPMSDTAISSDRPYVKFGFGNKKVAALANARSKAEGLSEWFGNGEEKDDKKKRVEQILKDSMENANQENMQL